MNRRSPRSKHWPLRTVLVLSLLVNLALGVANFALQPIWRAAEVASSVASAKAQAKLAQRAAVARAVSATKARADYDQAIAVAKIKHLERTRYKARQATAVIALKAQAEIKERSAVKKARSEEKVKARLRRLAVATPFVGFAIAGGFEYYDYQSWKVDNPDGDISDYGRETADLISEFSAEVLDELPEKLRPDQEKLLSQFNRLLESLPGASP